MRLKWGIKKCELNFYIQLKCHICLFLFQVVDKFTLKNEFDDLSKVEKFEMSLEDYSKRTGMNLNVSNLLII